MCCEIAYPIVSILNRPNLVDIQVDCSQLVGNITDQLHLLIKIGDLVEIIIMRDKRYGQKQNEQDDNHYIADIV